MPKQTKIIDSTNEILSKNGASVQLNVKGVCGGLACLYVRYALEGKNKKQEFFHLSKKLANLPINYQLGQDSALDKFISEIEIEFNRFKYSKRQYYQGDMGSEVFIDGKPIKKEFSIGLVQNVDKWATILEQIRNDGRSCYVRSHNHAIAISFVDNEYEVYDPNYDEDNDETPNAIETNTRRFINPTDVITELSRQFGYPQNSDVGLGIILYAHPEEKKPASYPDHNTLLNTSLKTQSDYDKKIAVNNDKWNYTSLFFATNINDKATVEYHLQNNKISLKDCAYLMYMDSNNQTVLDVHKSCNEKEKLILIYYSIDTGNIELFKKMTEDYQNTYVKTGLQRQLFKTNIENLFLARAARSENPVCFLQILELYNKYGISLSTIKQNELTIIIENLTKNGDITLLNALVGQIPKLSKEAVFTGIRMAAKQDKHDALKFWLKLSTTLDNGIDNTLINEELISTCSLLNYQQIIQTGFSVNPSLFRSALKRNHKEFFEEALNTNPNSSWMDFHEQLTKNKESSIDLFKEYDGLDVLTCLISYQANDLIKKYWPEHVTSEAGTKALAFACESGNQYMVEFLTNKGFKVPTSFQIEQLNKAVISNDHAKIDALLASHINYPQFFSKDNDDLIKGLIRIGKSEFIIKAWNDYKKNHQVQNPLGTKIISIDDLLWTALSKNNKGLYEFIAKKEPESALKLLKLLIDHKNPTDYYIYAINLAETLALTNLHQFIKSELNEYEQVLFGRTTKGDERADKKFREEARGMIKPLIDLLSYTIANNYFSLAEKLNSQIHLSQNELLELFISANKNKNAKVTQFLLTHYPYLSNQKDVYLKLAESNQFELLAIFLAQNESLDQTIYVTLLKKAVQAHHEQTIELLARYINTAYKIEGSAIYQAIDEENVKGCTLLLKYQDNLDEIPLPRKLIHTAIQQNDTALLHAAFQKPKFVAYFKKDVTDNLEFILKKGTPEAILYLYKQVDQDEFFTEFLNHAIATNNVALLKQLQKNNQFTTLDRKQLFHQACEMKALGIINELLSSPMEFNDKKELHAQLDKLFNVEKKESTINAHDIYNLIYEQALHRLYEFVKFNRYSAFSLLHHSITELMDDLPEDSPFKNYLFQRALEEGNQEKLDILLKQVQNLPALNEESISLFYNNLDKPLIITALLHHYKLNEVLGKAAELGNWSIVATLLQGRTAEEINPQIMEQLKSHDAELINTIKESAKNHLKDDPRHALNDLLIAKNNLALSAILTNKREQIEDTIMMVQQLMTEQKIDLKGLSYRFDLYHEIQKAKQVLEELTPKIKLFFKRNKNVPMQDLVKNEHTRNELLEIKKPLEANNLVPAHFEQRDQLENAFNALKAFDKVQKAEHDLKPKQEDQSQSPAEHPLNELVKIVQHYRAERKAENKTHHWFSIFQYTKQDKRSAAKNFINALHNPAHLINDKDRAVLNDGRLHTRIHEYLKANQNAIQHYFKLQKPVQTVDQFISMMNQQDPVAKLIHILKSYEVDRSKQPETYHIALFPQYTKTDKRKAVIGLIGLLQGKNIHLSEKDKGALNQGSLGLLVSGFIHEFNIPLKNVFQVEKMNNLDDLTKACSKKIPYNEFK